MSLVRVAGKIKTPLMKRWLVVFGLLVPIFFTGFRVEAQDMAHRLQGKAAEALRGVTRVERGLDLLHDRKNGGRIAALSLTQLA